MTRARQIGLSFVLVLVACGIGVFWFLWGRNDRSFLEFVPAVLDLRGTAILEGKTVETSVLLHNNSDRLVRVVSAASSCGCLAFEPGSGTSIPFMLHARKSLSVALKLGTHGRAGVSRYSLVLQSETEDHASAAPCVLSIITDVTSSLSAFPPRLLFQLTPADSARELTQTVVLADSWTGEGPHIRSVLTTRAMFDVHGKPVEGTFVYAGKELKQRYLLTVRLPSGQQRDSTNDVIRVTTDSPIVPEITIPIVLAVKHPFRVSPSSMTVFGRMGVAMTKSITFVWDDGVVRKVEVVNRPSGVTQVRQTVSTSRVTTFEITVTPDGRSHNDTIGFGVEGSDEPFVIPLRFITNDS